MSRSGFRLALCALVGAFALGSVLSGTALAGKKKSKAKPKAKAAPTAQFKGDAKALGELMGPFKFGMSSRDILGILSKQIGDKYKDKIAATTDVYAQDKLRRDRQAELDRIKKSQTEFKGTKTGWDVSIIDDQFAHNTDESMMVYWENDAESHKDQRRFFFFHDGRLYKMLIALNSSNLKNEQRTFDYFRGLMEARYGKGSVRTAKDADGVDRPVALEWRSKSHHVSALDKLAFYGSFVLVVADPGQEATLAEIRTQNAKPKAKSTALETVLEKKGEDQLGLDDNKSAEDSVIKGN
jgi:hypothetical protein